MIIDDAELKETYAARQPYGEWLDRGLIRLKDLPVPNKKVPGYSQEELTRLEKAFGYTYEDVKDTILPMARTGAEPTAAMGVDIPLAVLSDHAPAPVQLLQAALRPGDQSRPSTPSGRRWSPTLPSIWATTATCWRSGRRTAHVLQVDNPILTSVDLMKIRDMKQPGFQVETVSILYYKNTPLKRALDHLFVAGGPGLHATGLTSSSSPTGGWTRTMWPSRPCWRSPPWSST